MVIALKSVAKVLIICDNGIDLLAINVRYYEH